VASSTDLVPLQFPGDFYQLPPVSKDGKRMFAFESECWRKCIKLEVRRASFTTKLRTKRKAAYRLNFAGSRSAVLVRGLT
jgi:hypothetical protein